MSRRPTLCLAVLALCIALPAALACEIRVRDSAFRMVRDVHRLCVIADASDASADGIHQRLSQWLDQTDGRFNLRIERIDADDPETDWRSLGIPSAPPSLPVTVLVGRDNGIGESFIVDHWEPAPTDEELAAILDSPARRQLSGELAANIAVLVFAPRDPGSASEVSRTIESIIDAPIADERIGLSTITIDRYDPAERLLCQFMGIRPDSPDTLCVAFGRGKLMSPPLIDEQINAESIHTLVSTIRQACSCSRPLATMGVDMPLVWSDVVDASVILMDDDIELSELDAEVQNMLAAKAGDGQSEQPTMIPIPAGQPPESPAAVATSNEQVATVAVATSDPTATLAVGFCAVAIVAFAVLLIRRRSST